MQNKFYDVIVVGAGILGVSHAYHCLKAGLKVALMEKNFAPRGATVQNFGQIVPSGFGSKWQAFGRESLKFYKEIQAEMDISAKQEGSIYLASNEEEISLLEELAAINQHNDYTSELWTRQQCLDRYPDLQPKYVKGGLFFPEEIKLDPRLAIHRIIQFCVEKYGLDYFPATPIKNVLYANDQVVLTTANRQFFHCQDSFICNGNDFEFLFPELFAQSDLQQVKIHMMDTVPQKNQHIPGSILTGWTIRRYESFQECPSYAEIKAKENPKAFQNLKGIHILFKQSPDGSVIIGDSHDYADVANGEQLSFDTENEINCFILTQAQRIFQLKDWRIRNTWLGHYSQCKTQEIFQKTIDGHIHIITGIGGKGMTGSLGFAHQNIQQLLSLNLSRLSS